MKARDLLAQSIEELKTQYVEVRREIFRLRNELHASRKLDKPHQLREKKRLCARILTILRQKEGSEINDEEK